ncbi:hypothetical protein B296_00032020 [Ensete ventricosum]|nr:hypothetical protein B296_00032020 [Ensete ventricosum]
MVHTVVAPIERAKLLLQTQESNAALLGRGRRFRGMIDCLARTVREEGVLSLWRGNGTSVLRYYPSVALNFSLKVPSTLLPSLVNRSNLGVLGSVLVLTVRVWESFLVLVLLISCDDGIGYFSCRFLRIDVNAPAPAAPVVYFCETLTGRMYDADTSSHFSKE